jgi:hypothetical protein
LELSARCAKRTFIPNGFALNALSELRVRADGATFGGMRSGRDHFNKGDYFSTSLRLKNRPKAAAPAVKCLGHP